MTKSRLISEINAIATEYCGSQLAGLASMSKDALQAKLERLQPMITHYRAYVAIIGQYSEMQRKAFALMGDQAPADYQQAWQEYMKAIHIWRNQ